MELKTQAEKIEISVVVPLYNEEGNVEKLHEAIVEACDKLDKQYEIIFVDDGSSDKTIELAEKLSPLTFIRLRKNFGQTAAFDAGIKQAQGDVIITMDGDLQNDPSDISLLLQKMKTENLDVVAGWRAKRRDTLSKRITSRTANKLRKVFFDDNIHDSGCALKAYKRECFKDIELFGEVHRFIPALLQIQGYSIGEVKVNHRPRVSGVSKYGNFRRGFKSFVDMIAIWFWKNYSNRPLHLLGGTGLTLSAVGTLILVWMAFERIVLGVEISDRIWPLMGVFCIFTGIQLFTVGLVTDIVMKSYYRNHGKMNYSIKEVSHL